MAAASPALTPEEEAKRKEDERRHKEEEKARREEERRKQKAEAMERMRKLRQEGGDADVIIASPSAAASVSGTRRLATAHSHFTQPTIRSCRCPRPRRTSPL